MATCAVTFTIKDAAGTAQVGVYVRGKYVTPQGTSSDTIVASHAWVDASTDAAGLATLNLEQGSMCRILCRDAGLDLDFQVPALSTYNFAEEI